MQLAYSNIHIITAACRVGVQQCSEGVCTCKSGYTGINCCICRPDHYREGQQCKRESVMNNQAYDIKPSAIKCILV